MRAVVDLLRQAAEREARARKRDDERAAAKHRSIAGALWQLLSGKIGNAGTVVQTRL